jgi:hypothetical protein
MAEATFAATPQEVGMRILRMLLAASLFLVLTPALGSAENKCNAGKIKATAKKVLCKGKLVSKQAMTGDAPDPEKVAKCESKFLDKFTKLEADGGCPTTGDAAAIEASVDAFLAGLVDALCPNTCLNGGTLNPDCSCTCPAGYESLNGGCFRIRPALIFDCGGGCNNVSGSVDGSGNFLCMGIPGAACATTSECPLGSACQVSDFQACLPQCTSP